MSLSLVLKNIYSFLKVLEQAHGRHVGEWDTQSLTNACRWATYCEQIYERATGKSYCTELDRQVTLMGSLPWTLGDTKVNLGLLHCATRHLTQALIQNPFLSDELFESLVRLTTTDALLQDCWHMSTAKAGLQVAATVRKLVLPSSGSETSERSDVIRSEAVVLIDYIDRVLMGGELHANRCEDVLRNKLNSLSLQSHGRRVVLTALVMAPHTDPCPLQAPARTQDVLLQHLLHQPRDQLREMWKLPQELLCEVCAGHVRFYALYMRHLVELADTIPRHTSHSPGEHEHRRCHQEADTESTSDTYTVIRTCLTSLLLHAGKRVAMATRRTMQSLVQGSNGTVWKQLLNDTTDCRLPVECHQMTHLYHPPSSPISPSIHPPISCIDLS